MKLFDFLRLELMDAVETVFKRSADIVILNTPSLKMIRQMLTRGEMLFVHDEAAECLYAFHKQLSITSKKDRQELKSKTALRHYRPPKVVPSSKHDR